MVQFLHPETTEILQFLHPEIVKMDKKILDPETVEMVGFLNPEIVEKVDKSFMKYLDNILREKCLQSVCGLYVKCLEIV